MSWEKFDAARAANATDRGKTLAARHGMHAKTVAKRTLANKQIDERDARGYGRGGSSHPAMPSLNDQMRYHNEAQAKGYGAHAGGIHALPRSLGDSAGGPPLHADFNVVKATASPRTGTFVDQSRTPNGSQFNSDKFSAR